MKRQNSVVDSQVVASLCVQRRASSGAIGNPVRFPSMYDIDEKVKNHILIPHPNNPRHRNQIAHPVCDNSVSPLDLATPSLGHDDSGLAVSPSHCADLVEVSGFLKLVTLNKWIYAEGIGISADDSVSEEEMRLKLQGRISEWRHKEEPNSQNNYIRELRRNTSKIAVLPTSKRSNTAPPPVKNRNVSAEKADPEKKLPGGIATPSSHSQAPVDIKQSSRRRSSTDTIQVKHNDSKGLARTKMSTDTKKVSPTKTAVDTQNKRSTSYTRKPTLVGTGNEIKKSSQTSPDKPKLLKRQTSSFVKSDGEKKNTFKGNLLPQRVKNSNESPNVKPRDRPELKQDEHLVFSHIHPEHLEEFQPNVIKRNDVSLPNYDEACIQKTFHESPTQMSPMTDSQPYTAVDVPLRNISVGNSPAEAAAVDNSLVEIAGVLAAVENSPTEAATVGNSVVEATDVENSSIEAATVGNSVVEATGVGNSVVEATEENSPLEAAIVGNSVVEATDVGNSPIEATDVGNSPIEAATVENSPLEAATVENSPLEAAIVENSPLEATDVGNSPLESAIVGNPVVEATDVGNSPIEAAIVENMAAAAAKSEDIRKIPLTASADVVPSRKVLDISEKRDIPKVPELKSKGISSSASLKKKPPTKPSNPPKTTAVDASPKVSTEDDKNKRNVKIPPVNNIKAKRIAETMEKRENKSEIKEQPRKSMTTTKQDLTKSTSSRKSPVELAPPKVVDIRIPTVDFVTADTSDGNDSRVLAEQQGTNWDIDVGAVSPVVKMSMQGVKGEIPPFQATKADFKMSVSAEFRTDDSLQVTFPSIKKSQSLHYYRNKSLETPVLQSVPPAVKEQSPTSLRLNSSEIAVNRITPVAKVPPKTSIKKTSSPPSLQSDSRPTDSSKTAKPKPKVAKDENSEIENDITTQKKVKGAALLKLKVKETQLAAEAKPIEMKVVAAMKAKVKLSSEKTAQKQPIETTSGPPKMTIPPMVTSVPKIRVKVVPSPADTTANGGKSPTSTLLSPASSTLSSKVKPPTTIKSTAKPTTVSAASSKVKPPKSPTIKSTAKPTATTVSAASSKVKPPELPTIKTTAKPTVTTDQKPKPSLSQPAVKEKKRVVTAAARTLGIDKKKKDTISTSPLLKTKSWTSEIIAKEAEIDFKNRNVSSILHRWGTAIDLKATQVPVFTRSLTDPVKGIITLNKSSSSLEKEPVSAAILTKKLSPSLTRIVKGATSRGKFVPKAPAVLSKSKGPPQARPPLKLGVISLPPPVAVPSSFDGSSTFSSEKSCSATTPTNRNHRAIVVDRPSIAVPAVVLPSVETTILQKRELLPPKPKLGQEFQHLTYVPPTGIVADQFESMFHNRRNIEVTHHPREEIPMAGVAGGTMRTTKKEMNLKALEKLQAQDAISKNSQPSYWIFRECGKKVCCGADGSHLGELSPGSTPPLVSYVSKGPIVVCAHGNNDDGEIVREGVEHQLNVKIKSRKK